MLYALCFYKTEGYDFLNHQNKATLGDSYWTIQINLQGNHQPGIVSTNTLDLVDYG